MACSSQSFIQSLASVYDLCALSKSQSANPISVRADAVPGGYHTSIQVLINVESQ